MNKKLFSEIIFWLHLPIVLVWFGLFLVPELLWPAKITFHFWYIVSIIILQFLWGLILFPYTKKIDMICPLTTLMQRLRGIPVQDKRNYGHSFIAEFLARYNIKSSYKKVNIVLLITLVIIVIQFFWFN